MNKVYRQQIKSRIVGNSLGMTIPVRTRYKWDLEPGEQLVTYLLDDLMVVLPLRYLTSKGEHPLIAQLRATLEPTVP